MSVGRAAMLGGRMISSFPTLSRERWDRIKRGTVTYRYLVQRYRIL